MYIIYTFVCLAGLLVFQILGAVALPVASPLTIVALGIKLRSNSGFLFRRGNRLAALTSLPFSLLVFLETSVPIDHQHLMFLLISTSAVLSIDRSSGRDFFMPCIL